MTIHISGLDLETTGFEAPEGHRIVEVAILTYEFPSRRLVDTYVQRIDPDRNIPAAAQAVHGIAYADLVGKPKWEDVAPTVKAKLDACSLVVAHNAQFDGPFLGHELLRVGLDLPDADFFCTMEGARWATPNGKTPRLEELCFALNVPFNPSMAHSAEYDVAKMMEAFFEGLRRGFYEVPALSPAAILKAA
jgi:DNA polymerase-3 subunit epsilon